MIDAELVGAGLGGADLSGVARMAAVGSNSDLETSSDFVGLAKTQGYAGSADSEIAPSRLKASTFDAAAVQVEDPGRALGGNPSYDISTVGPSDLSLSLQTIELAQVGEPIDAALITRFDGEPGDAGFDRESVAIEDQTAAQSGVSLLSSLPSAEGSPPIAEITGTSKVIHLRKLVELIGDRFTPDELERLRNSRAIDTDLPIKVLERSGISLASLPGVEMSMEPVSSVRVSLDGRVPFIPRGTSEGAQEGPGLTPGFAATAHDPAVPSAEEMSPSIAEHGSTTRVVRLKKLVELLDDRFTSDELERLQSSPAIDTDLPVHVIEQSGISLASLPGAEALEVPASSSQEVVPLKGLVELVGNRFAPEELERLQNSPAIDAQVPVHVLEQSGISLASFPGTVASVAPLAGMQATGTGGASSGSSAGADDGLGINSDLKVTASAGYDSNPFLIETEDSAAPSIRVQLAPTLSSQTRRTSVRLSGRAEHIEYLGTYDSIQNFGADLTASHLANERLEIESGLNINRSVPATAIDDAAAGDNTSPDAPPPVSDTDITVLQQGRQQTRFGANAGLTYTLSERDQLRWSLTGQAQRFDEDELTETNSFGQRLEYVRVLDEGVSIGASVDMNLIEFTAPANGNARIISPQIQMTAALTPRLELAGSVGVAYNSIDIEGLEDTSTTVAGNVSLCHRDEYSSLCINGSRQFLPAAVGGATLRTNAGVTYSLRISERDTLRLNGSYAVSEVSDVANQAQDVENVNAFVRYERRLNEGLRLFVSGSYRNVSRDFTDDVANVGALIGITFDLGRSR
ncbi:MAG: hypothetical protein AAFY19_01140 [Pseudomonadota bacterium]